MKKLVRNKQAPLSEFEAMLAKVAKERGTQTLIKADKIPLANHISTGSFILDFALLGGPPEGFATMLLGFESSGKTMMAKKTVAGYLRKHEQRQVVWIDTEGMFDKDFASKLGCDLGRITVARPETGNEAVDLLESAMEPKECGLVVLDSIPGCVPMRVLEKSAEDKTVGELAALMGVMVSKILMSWAVQRKRNHFVTVLLINQWRMKIGQMFGDPRTLPGGRQINHIPTTKIELKNQEIAGKDTFEANMMVRNEHHFKIVKAKHGRSVREGETHMSLSAGENEGVEPFEFVNHKTVIAYAKRMGVLTGGGGKFRLSCLARNRTFRTMEDAGRHLIENSSDMLRVQQHLIAMQRVDKGMDALPSDGYLLDWENTVEG